MHDLLDFEWHVVRNKVHCLQSGVREESVLSKQGINSWLKAFALHTDLRKDDNIRSVMISTHKSSQSAKRFYLHHVDVKAECLQSHLKHEFLGQVAGSLKDHVALHGSDFVVARELGGVHDGPDLISLQGITDLLSQSVGERKVQLLIIFGALLTTHHNMLKKSNSCECTTALHSLCGLRVS